MLKRTFIFLIIFPLFLKAEVNTIDSLKTLVRTSTDSSVLRYLNELASGYFKISEYDSALVYSRQSISLQSKFNYPMQRLASYSLLASSFYRKADFKASLEVSLTGLELAEKLNSFSNKYFFIANIGTVYHQMHKQELSMNYFLKALSLVEPEKDTLRIGEIYTNIATLYIDNNNYPLALISARKGLSALLSKYKTTPNQVNIRTLSNAYSEVGVVLAYMYKNKIGSKSLLDSSVLYFSEALKLIRKLKDEKRLLSSLLINTSDICNTLGDYHKAIDLLMEALEVSKNESYVYQIVIKINLGDTYRGLNNHALSIQYLQNAIALSKQYHAEDLLSEANLSLSKTYEKIGRYNEAFLTYKNYSRYKDSLLSVQSSNEISNAITKYETDKNEAEIQILTKDSELQQDEINNQNTVKNVVLLGLVFILLLSFLLLGRYRLTKRLNSELDRTNTLINKTNRIIMDSISYAERIQRLIMPGFEDIRRRFSDSFLLYLPKDIIGGDLYWFGKDRNTFLIAAVDCTGHGVPGAMLSMVAYNLLNRSVKPGATSDAAAIITNVKKGLENFVAQSIDKTEVRDGMDMVVCSIDTNTFELSFAGAQNSVYIVRNNELNELKGESVSMGDAAFANHVFTPHKMQLQKGDWIYWFTDGYADQKGGPKNKKFYYKPFQDLIVQINQLNGAEQKQKLNEVFQNWKGSFEQLDDVLILGIKI